MKILMLETRRGSEDGHIPRPFKAGEIYDIAHTLAAAFINVGWAVKMETQNDHH